MANRKLTTVANFSKKDAFNITGAETLQNQTGKVIKVNGCAIGIDVSHDTGEDVVTGYLKDENGNIFSTISKTAIDAIAELCDIITDVNGTEDFGDGIEVMVNSRKSRGGRDFIVLTLM